MARKPNYQFERAERDRQKAAKVAEKARLKQAAKEQADRDAGRLPAAESDADQDS